MRCPYQQAVVGVGHQPVLETVGIEIPKIEVRYENLSVEGDVYVGSRALPTLLNVTFNTLESVLGLFHLAPSKKREIQILKHVSGIVKPSRERDAGIKPDPEIDAFMKAIALSGQKSSFVTDYVLKMLGLDICADIMVGDEMRRGISGGQKKRVTTGNNFSYQSLQIEGMSGVRYASMALSLFRFVAAIGRSLVIANSLGTLTLLVPNTDTRFDAPTIGKVLLKSRGLYTEDYWYWICLGVLVGFSLLFNLLFILALTYLNPLVDSKAVTADEDDKKNGNPSSRHLPIEGLFMY
ncbi:hypothetical protein TSUD_339230 [Trifolium subterraneum]|nr:hypothetical protein TSUD_339230 [Trifolium subterraneum]